MELKCFVSNRSGFSSVSGPVETTIAAKGGFLVTHEPKIPSLCRRLRNRYQFILRANSKSSEGNRYQ